MVPKGQVRHQSNAQVFTLVERARRCPGDAGLTHASSQLPRETPTADESKTYLPGALCGGGVVSSTSEVLRLTRHRGHKGRMSRSVPVMTRRMGGEAINRKHGQQTHAGA